MGIMQFIKNLFKKKMQAGDRLLGCQECRGEFVFEAGEQAFFKERGLSEPKRCPSCRKRNRRGSRFGRRSSGRPAHASLERRSGQRGYERSAR
jgi:hypothetical protein